MKKIPEILIVCLIAFGLGALINGSSRRFTRDAETKLTPIKAVEPYKPHQEEDFVMMSATAKSNAAYFGKPPEGWDVVCDDQGRYAPRHLSKWKPGGGYVIDSSIYIRTNLNEGIIAAWRVKEVWDGIDAEARTNPKPPINWKPCE